MRPDFARSLSARDAALLARALRRQRLAGDRHPIVGRRAVKATGATRRDGRRRSGYFRTQGICLLSGGLLTAQDLSERAPVAD
ncbi:hypothetical protein J4732_09240 [Serratia marcescens]|uniref:Uncharacterized protein n=1 Tax=Serratia marcescens TaxID=615 RepID=A0A939NJU2_SERMA|nr:hypothetical protein [Serratia marcescens]